MNSPITPDEVSPFLKEEWRELLFELSYLTSEAAIISKAIDALTHVWWREQQKDEDHFLCRDTVWHLTHILTEIIFPRIAEINKRLRDSDPAESDEEEVE